MRKKENGKRVVLEIALFASAVLLMALTFHSCQKDEVPDQVTTDQEVVITKSGASGGDCANDCIDPDDPEYFEAQESKTITWGLGKNSKTVEVIYYNTLSDFVIKVMSSNGIADVLMDDISIKNFEGTIAPNLWQEIAFPLAENWAACESWSFELKVAGYGPPASFDVEYELIGECTTLYTLELAVSPEGAGTVDGAGQYAEEIEIMLTATANDGYVFLNWTDENDVVSEVADFTYTMPAMNKTLTANFDEEVISFVCGESTITDIEGNVYNTVSINGQCWLKENLRTTIYSNGQPVPFLTDAQWAFAITPGYCWYYNFTDAQKETYGALYNWYAVETGNLCPSGWHVPTDAEWTLLTDYYGGVSIAGGPLKEEGLTHWDYPNVGATNVDDFTALPGGTRQGYNEYTPGLFNLLGKAACFWTSTEYQAQNEPETFGMGRLIFWYDAFIDPVNVNKEAGYSVRCVKD